MGGSPGQVAAAGTMEALAIRDRLIVEGIRQHGGTILGAPGGDDRLCATFAGAAQAVAAACVLQRDIRTQPRLADLAPRVVVHAGGDDSDDPWRVADICDQVRSFAEAGQVLIGGTIPALLHAALPPGTRLVPFANQLPGHLSEMGAIYEVALGRTQEEVDRYLHDLATRAAAVSDELSDLLSNLVYRLLVRSGETTGLTLSRAAGPLAAVEALRPGFASVQALLADAGAARTDWMRLAPDEVGELEGLLFGPSIELPDRARTPAEVLADMAEAVNAASAVVAEVGHAWKEAVPRLASCQDELEALYDRATSLGAAGLAEGLADLGAQVRSLAALAPSDPLRVAAALDEGVLDRLARARSGVEGEVRQQRAVATEVERARARLAQVRAVHRQAVKGLRELRLAIADPRQVQAPDEAYLDTPPMGLGPWLMRLDELCRAGSYRAVRKGLERWRQAADRALAGEREVLVAIRAPFQRRKELRGLLIALEAKAAAMGLAEDPEVAELGRLARTVLFTSPTDLSVADQRVRQYQAHILTRTRPMHRKVKQG